MVIVVILLWFVYFIRRELVRISFIYILTGIQIISVGAFFFLLWATYGGLKHTGYFLPPHSQILLTSTMRMFQPYLIGWVVALVLGFLLWFLFIKRGNSSILDVSDIFWIVLGAGICGWPTIFPLLATIILFTIFGMLVLVILKKRSINDRIVITPFVVPAIVTSLLSSPWVLAWTHLDKIRF